MTGNRLIRLLRCMAASINCDFCRPLSGSPPPCNLENPILLRSNGYIDGRWEAADSGATLVVTDPANGERLGEVPLMGPLKRRAPSPRLNLHCRPGGRRPPRSALRSCAAGST